MPALCAILDPMIRSGVKITPAKIKANLCSSGSVDMLMGMSDYAIGT